MKFTYDHDLHIHSYLSNCSRDPLQTPESILEYAKQNHLKQVCITDHFWDETVDGASGWYSQHHKFSQIAQSRPLPKDENVEFLFGCETELNKYFTLGISAERFKEFDFVVIPTTHLHMKGFTLEEEDCGNPDRLAKLWVKRVSAVLNMDLPFYKIGLAHLTCIHILRSSREKYLETLSLISNDDMFALFQQASKLGVGIELNAVDMSFAEKEADIILRPYYIAKECKCKFYLGSDAHHPQSFANTKSFARAIDMLGLEESDKFLLGKK